MKLLSNTLITILVSMHSIAYSQLLTLEDATRLMLTFEPELNATEYDTLSSIQNLKMVRSDQRPKVSLNGSAGVSNRDRTTDGLVRSGDTLFQRQLGLNVRQLLYDGGIARNNTMAAENAMMAQQYLEKAMIESRTVDLAEVYMEVLRTSRQIELARGNIKNHEKIVDLIQRKVDNGGHRTELRLVKSRLDRATNDLATQQLAFDKAITRLIRLVGRTNFELKHPQLPYIPSEVAKVNLDSNWEYLAAAEALEEAEHRAKAANAAHRPQFYFDAGYNIGRDSIGVAGRDDEVSALIVGEWNIFNGGRKKAQQRREHFQVGKFEELKRAADLQRNNDLYILWRERQASKQSIKILSTYETDLSNVVEDYEKRFSLGKEQLLNILDMQAEFYAAQSDYVNAQFDYDTSAFRIMGEQGLLTEWLLRLERQEKQVVTKSGGKNPQTEAIPVALAPEEELKDVREPITQVELMKKVFDGEGPTADYEPAPMEQYYKKKTISRFSKWLRDRRESRKPTEATISLDQSTPTFDTQKKPRFKYRKAGR